MPNFPPYAILTLPLFGSPVLISRSDELKHTRSHNPPGSKLAASLN